MARTWPGRPRDFFWQWRTKAPRLTGISDRRRRINRIPPILTSRRRSTFYTLLVSPKRMRKMAVITKPSTLLRLHRVLVKHKYHLLNGSQRTRRPCPKGRSSQLIAAVIEMKRRNPRMGCRKIAEQISSALRLRSRDQPGCGPPDTDPALPTGARRRWPFLALGYRAGPRQPVERRPLPL